MYNTKEKNHPFHNSNKFSTQLTQEFKIIKTFALHVFVGFHVHHYFRTKPLMAKSLFFSFVNCHVEISQTMASPHVHALGTIGKPSMRIGVMK
jgi:hypothetical protein